MFSLTPWRKKSGSDGGALAPFRDNPVAWFRDEFDAMFDRFFGRLPHFERDWAFGPFWGLDVDDTGKDVVVRVEAPGFEVEDFDVHVSGNVLTIEAEHRKDAKEEKDDYHVAERRLARFQRSVTLPPGTDTQQVEARYRNGVLEIRLGKTPEAHGRRIEVKS